MKRKLKVGISTYRGERKDSFEVESGFYNRESFRGVLVSMYRHDDAEQGTCIQVSAADARRMAAALLAAADKAYGREARP